MESCIEKLCLLCFVCCFYSCAWALSGPPGQGEVFSLNSSVLLQHCHQGVWGVHLHGLRRERQQLCLKAELRGCVCSRCVSRECMRFKCLQWSSLGLNLEIIQGVGGETGRESLNCFHYLVKTIILAWHLKNLLPWYRGLMFRNQSIIKL